MSLDFWMTAPLCELNEAWQSEDSLSAALGVLSREDELAKLALATAKIYIVRTGVVEHEVYKLQAGALVRRVHLNIRISDWTGAIESFSTDVLDSFQPDVIIVTHPIGEEAIQALSARAHARAHAPVIQGPTPLAWLQQIFPIIGRTCKLLITDLDGTLWRGVVGEDVGIGSRALTQAHLLVHRDNGILLAVCSRNNPKDAVAALRQQWIKPEDFAFLSIDWRPKPERIVEIAKALQFGLKHVAFVDADLRERNAIRHALPDVTVLSPDQLGLAPELAHAVLTDEDRQRAQLYQDQEARGEARVEMSLEEYLSTLGTAARIAPLDERTAERAAQLTQRVTQFNTSGKKGTAQELMGGLRLHSGAYEMYTLQLEDCFGPLGIVGFATIWFNEIGEATIDGFFLSCRAIGRGAETALLAHLISRARARGAQAVKGWFERTNRNEPAADFYKRHGFRLVVADGDNLEVWMLELDKADIQCPEWIQLRS